MFRTAPKCLISMELSIFEYSLISLQRDIMMQRRSKALVATKSEYIKLKISRYISSSVNANKIPITTALY